MFTAFIPGRLAWDKVGVVVGAAGQDSKVKAAREKLDGAGLAQEVAKEERVARELVDMLWWVSLFLCILSGYLKGLHPAHSLYECF